jgi:copper chaperone NosL
VTWRAAFATLLLATTLTACDAEDVAEAPPPAEVAGDVTGYFCGMLLVEHGGPKGQIHLKSRDKPVWFSSVRDTVAFTLLEEEPKDIAAIYVNDMGRATSWEQPEPGTWIEAQQAWFVIDSRRVGGMGLPEAVPFGTEDAAAAFAGANGGRVVRLADIPADYVLGTPELPAQTGADTEAHDATH